MAILPILKDPDPKLRVKSLPVERIDDSIRDFMNSLLETMYHDNGGGIAAIQVGNPIQAFIVNLPKQSEDNAKIIKTKFPLFIINPTDIVFSTEKIVLPEGCLSVREEDTSFIRGDVARPISIALNFLDLDGNTQSLAIDGTKSEHDLWLARVIQHELDHLDGILFIDKLYDESK